MKVNMSMLTDDTDAPKKVPVLPEADDDEKEPAVEEEEDEDEEEDESDSHSKLKTALLVAAMIGGFALFVWNMTGLVNNMRLDNQGNATAIVYDVEDLSSFMDMSGSGSVTVDATTLESEVSTDAARDGPGAETPAKEDGAGQVTETGNESDSELKKQRDDALNDKALKERELEQAAEMLDAALQREENLQGILEEHGIDWRQ